MTSYQISKKTDTRQLAQFLSSNSQVILPMVELVESAQIAVDQLLEHLGRATLEAVLLISASGVAGEAHQGKPGGSVVRHGSQSGIVPLSTRKVRVQKPRLRRKEGGHGAEMEVPAYAAMQRDRSLGPKVLDTLMRCVSTRNYQKILPDACEAVGVSKSSVSREFVQASEEAYKALCEKRFDELDLLVIYIDGMVFGERHILGAVGIDSEGYKHVLGVADGATENGAVVTSLLEALVERGIKPGVRRLFVIDGSKALRQAIEKVYGADNPVQRCRIHKVRNVTDHLPEEHKSYAKLVMRAAFQRDPADGTKRLKELAEQYEKTYPSAAASIREGLDEMFTVGRLGIPGSLSRCLVSTNVIESPNAGVRMRTRRVTRWQDGAMVLRWAAAAFLATEKQFRRVSGHQHLWMLEAALGRDKQNAANAA
jgi:transposase-like protein